MPQQPPKFLLLYINKAAAQREGNCSRLCPPPMLVTLVGPGIWSLNEKRWVRHVKKNEPFNAAETDAASPPLTPGDHVTSTSVKRVRGCRDASRPPLCTVDSRLSLRCSPIRLRPSLSSALELNNGG